MHSIITLFRYTLGWGASLGIIIPVIGAIMARRNGVKLSFEMKLFEVYCYVAVISQYAATINAYTFRYHWQIFRVFTIIEAIILFYLLLKWLNFEKYYIKFLAIFFPILFIGDYYIESRYPDFMVWLELSILGILALLLSLKIDKDFINFPKGHSYIHLGIYLYCIITAIGFTPPESELRPFGHLIHVFATYVSIYFYYRSFRCLYP